MEENNELINNPAVEYTDDNIRHLSDMEHVLSLIHISEPTRHRS